MKEEIFVCQTHSTRRTIVFSDKTTVCLTCLEDMVTKNKPREREIFLRVTEALPPRMLSVLNQRLEGVASSRKCGPWGALLLIVALYALRQKNSVDEVLEEVSKTRSVEWLFISSPVSVIV